MRDKMLALVGALAVVGCVVVDPAQRVPTPAEQLAERRRLHAEYLAKVGERDRKAQEERRERQRALEAQAATAREEAAARFAAEKTALKEEEEKLLAEWRALAARVKAPAPAVTVRASALRGPPSALKAKWHGKRIRVEGAVSTVNQGVVAEKMGGVQRIKGAFVALVPVLGKQRFVGCKWTGPTAFYAAQKTGDGDQVALVGTLSEARVEGKATLITLDDCDPPIILKKKPEAPNFRISAAKLTAEYVRNQIAARKEYEDYIIEVTGPVHKVAHGWVILRGHTARHRVYCELASDESDAAVASLARGRRAILKGLVATYQGPTWRDQWREGVVMTSCSVLKR